MMSRLRLTVNEAKPKTERSGSGGGYAAGAGSRPSALEPGGPAMDRLKDKVVLITGYPLTPVIQQKVTAGRYVYFAKPFDNRILVAKVKELLG